MGRVCMGRVCYGPSCPVTVEFCRLYCNLYVNLLFPMYLLYLVLKQSTVLEFIISSVKMFQEKELQNHLWPVVKGSYTLSDF